MEAAIINIKSCSIQHIHHPASYSQDGTDAYCTCGKKMMRDSDRMLNDEGEEE